MLAQMLNNYTKSLHLYKYWNLKWSRWFSNICMPFFLITIGLFTECTTCLIFNMQIIFWTIFNNSSNVHMIYPKTVCICIEDYLVLIRFQFHAVALFYAVSSMHHCPGFGLLSNLPNCWSQALKVNHKVSGMI